MKKIFPFTLLSLSVLSLSACGSDEDPSFPDPTPPDVAKGAFLLYQGNESLKLEGDLSIIDYAGNSITPNLFRTANARSLGNTPQCGLAYGGKIYLGILESNTIEIIDRKTYRSVKQIRLENSTSGQNPRSMVAKDGNVYVSMWDGYITRLDTLSLNIEEAVKVGPNPEEIAIRGNYIFVPNSDGLNWPDYGTSASLVSISPFKEESRFEVPLNPAKFITNGDNVYLLCKGNYGDIPAALYEIKGDLTYEKIADATDCAIKGKSLYYINSPWILGESAPRKPTLFKYDIPTKNATEMKIETVPAPSGFGVDPESGYIVIPSNPVENGVCMSTLPGTVSVFSADGALLKEFDGGVGPAYVFFNAK